MILKTKIDLKKRLITYNRHPWIMFSFNWLVIIWRGGSSFAIGSPRSRGWSNFRRRWTRRVRSLENWTIFMDVTCVSSQMINHLNGSISLYYKSCHKLVVLQFWDLWFIMFSKKFTLWNCWIALLYVYVLYCLSSREKLLIITVLYLLITAKLKINVFP